MPWATPTGLQPRMPSMTTVKCEPYEKFNMKMDFLYRPRWLQEFKQVTANDQDMQQLISAIHYGWPSRWKDCPAKLVPYYDSRNELFEESGLVYQKECPPKTIQEQHCNTKSQLLALLQPGWVIRMKLPSDTKWSLGSCVKILPNCLHEVEVIGCATVATDISLKQWLRHCHWLSITTSLQPCL